MLILGIDSSATAGSVAVSEGGKLLAENFINIGLTHSQTLMPLVANTLKTINKTMADIDLIALTIGPGSFTGIRIGLATAKGLAAPYDIPIYGVSSLACIAKPLKNSNSIVVSLMDARNNQVYYAIFHSEIDKIYRLTEDKADSLENVSKVLQEYGESKILIGDGADIAYDYLKPTCKNIFKASEQFKYQRASSAIFIAEDEIKNQGKSPLNHALLKPSYLRLPQAERELKIRQSDKKT